MVKIQYKDVISLENLNRGLMRTKNNVSPGLDGETKGQMSGEKMEKLHIELTCQKYKPRPTRRINIPKPDGGTRPLGISSQRDKVVQGAILEALEPVLEQIFLPQSFGARPKKNCHLALKEIKVRWKGVKWLISIDVRKYFDTINHQILLEKLEEFADQATVELIGKLLKVGYVDLQYADAEERAKEGTPQGSLISPLMANLYLHALDSHVMDTLVPKWNRGDRRPPAPGYNHHEDLTSKEKALAEEVNLPGVAEAIGRIKHNQWVLNEAATKDTSSSRFKRLHYVRYVDDFVLGFIGSKSEATEIDKEVKNFLNEKLRLQVNEEKSKIYHSSESGFRYLGFYIRYLDTNQIVLDPLKSGKEDAVKQLKATAFNSAQLRVPVLTLMERAVDKGYACLRTDGTARATASLKLATLEERQIVLHFSSIIRGILEYYSPANKYSDLWPVVSLYRKSCALTLANKLKYRTSAAIFNKYGAYLKVTDPLDPKKTATLHYPKTLKTTQNFRLGRQSLTPHLLEPREVLATHSKNIRTALFCQFPGCSETEGLQEHHINPVKNIPKNLSPFEQSLRRRKRKTIALCEKHHKEVHNLLTENDKRHKR